MKSRIDGLKPLGGGVYEDSKGRMYVGDRKKEILYAVDRGSKNRLHFFQQRHTIALVLLLMTGFYFSWYLGIALAILSFVLFEYAYRARFLSTLPVYENIEIPKNPSLKERFAATDTPKLLMIMGLSLLLGILLVVNLLQAVEDWSTAFRDTNVLLLILVTIAMDLYILYFLINGLSVLLDRKK